MSDNKISELAKDVLKLSRNTLLVNLRFLDMALSRFELAEIPISMPDGPVATDGKQLIYEPKSVLRCCREDKNLMTRNYLHTVLHCVFSHPFINTLVNRACWDLACDIAVEHTINGLGLKTVECERMQQQLPVLEDLQNKVKYMTAEKLYRYYLDLKLPDEQYMAIRKLFCGDDHTVWYLPEEYSAYTSASDEKSGDAGEDRQSDSAGKPNTAGSAIRLREDWKIISERMQTDMETFGKQRGDAAGALTQNLREVNRERYDYSDFLWHFTTMGEAMKINDDEFDYIFYTYGMKLYDRMPLIEPLEYKEVRRIKDFVIAIDTSGSVQGELVQRFIQKTYNILMQQESFFTKINLHIVQCDAEIQQITKITKREEFEDYIKTMKLHGFGGTDFRPVFEYIDRVRKEGELRNLKGMIYFTDGYGIFPERMPDYLSAFVFVNDDYETPEVPVWAIKLVLQSDEI